MSNFLSRNEEILRAIIDGTEYSKVPQSREEALLLELKDAVESGGGGTGAGGTTNYNKLSNKPSINGTILQGNMTLEDIGIEEMSSDDLAALWND